MIQKQSANGISLLCHSNLLDLISPIFSPFSISSIPIPHTLNILYFLQTFLFKSALFYIFHNKKIYHIKNLPHKNSYYSFVFIVLVYVWTIKDPDTTSNLGLGFRIWGWCYDDVQIFTNFFFLKLVIGRDTYNCIPTLKSVFSLVSIQFRDVLYVVTGFRWSVRLSLVTDR